MITDINQLDFSKQYTYADYLTWWFDERVELIKGYILKMSPAPSLKHQSIHRKIITEIAPFFKKNKCQLFYAPFDVRLTRKVIDSEVITVVQPDICVICNPDLLDERGCNGPPDLIIEILSIGNKKHDINTKFLLYQEAGVKEYWIVAPSDELIDKFVLVDGKFKLFQKYAEDQIIESDTLPGLKINLLDIFNEF